MVGDAIERLLMVGDPGQLEPFTTVDATRWTGLEASPLTPSPQAGREQAVVSFKNRAYEIFSNLYYDDPQSPNSEWPVPDSEDPDQPHAPQLLSWDGRVLGYDSVADVADILCEGEYRTLTNAILDKLGRPTL